MSEDVDRLRSTLVRFEREARALPWADKRRWTSSSHVWAESGVATVDLHDLNVKLANQVVEATLDVATSCDGGAIVFVTGRGTHSMGGGSDLQDSVTSLLDRSCRNRGWTYHPARAGRYVIVMDPAKAPAIARSELPIGVIAGVVIFLLLALYFATPVGVVLTLIAAGGFWAVRKQTVGYAKKS
jgi:hypothetical protein